MITFYSGTPGSGKSLRVARTIVQHICVLKKNVITNMDIDYDYIRTSKVKSFFGKKDCFKKNVGKYYYFNNQQMTPENLIKYAYKFHKKGRENQTLIVIDEAQMILSPTVVKLKTQEDKTYRQRWLEFCTQHRHLGFNIIIVSQFDRLIDPQVRCLFEYNCIHRKVNRFKIGWVLGIFGISLFVAVEYWYGINARMGATFFLYHKKYSRIYDSYKRFDERN